MYEITFVLRTDLIWHPRNIHRIIFSPFSRNLHANKTRNLRMYVLRVNLYEHAHGLRSRPWQATDHIKCGSGFIQLIIGFRRNER
jgi:hypothetical protein